MEPGDDRPSTHGDTTHHLGAKRPRLNIAAPPATRTTITHPSAAAAACAAAASSSTDFAPVRSPYASIGRAGVGRVASRPGNSLSGVLRRDQIGGGSFPQSRSPWGGFCASKYAWLVTEVSLA